VALRKAKVEVLYIQADVANKDDRYRLLEEIKEHFGCLNVLVNNAGMAPENRADILEATEESFDRVMAVNLKGPYFLTQATARWMIRQKQADLNYEGCVINISSISATVASSNRGDYCVSKAGLSMATKLWAARLGEFSIPVYEIRPGVVMTDMTAAVKERYDKLIEEGLTIQGRWGLPEDIGRAVAMLVRGDLVYSTGR
jgi:NAD(P)-dependent dehydrogenase (short-subunit alcohol dehydrogenase family)